MSEELSEDLIRYDVLTQEAMRGVVKKVISEAAKAGLPGDHHFFISFITGFPGVRLSSRMRERYPDEMTIVVQHQYWELKATENSFEIGLSFDEIPENLSIPFAAIKGFFDPSVQFGLQFDIAEPDEDGELIILNVDSESTKTKPDLHIAEVPTEEPIAIKPASADTAPKAKSKRKSKGKKKSAKSGDGKTSAQKDSGADVVSLDAFRKKP